MKNNNRSEISLDTGSSALSLCFGFAGRDHTFDGRAFYIDLLFRKVLGLGLPGFLKENVTHAVWTCRDPISLIIGA